MLLPLSIPRLPLMLPLPLVLILLQHPAYCLRVRR